MNDELKRAKRILIIDDDQEITESMRLTLEMRGYEVFNATDGNQGLLMTEQKKTGPDHPRYDDAETQRISCPGKSSPYSSYPDPRDHDHGKRRKSPQIVC